MVKWFSYPKSILQKFFHIFTNFLNILFHFFKSKFTLQLNDRIVFKRIPPSRLRDCCQVATGASGLNLPSVLISNFAPVNQPQPTQLVAQTTGKKRAAAADSFEEGVPADVIAGVFSFLFFSSAASNEKIRKILRSDSCGVRI